MHSKRQQVLDKLAERCLAELSKGSAPDTDLIRLYLNHSREGAAALATAVEHEIFVEKPYELLDLAKALAELVRAVR